MRPPEETRRDAERILALDKEATKGPWSFESCAKDEAIINNNCWGFLVNFDGEPAATDPYVDQDLIMESRTLSPRLAQDALGLLAENKRYREREAHFAEALRVTDGGQYRADWNSAIERVVKEQSELRAARISYASLFPPNQDGDPDTGTIHENIRRLKALLARALVFARHAPGIAEEAKALGVEVGT